MKKFKKSAMFFLVGIMLMASFSCVFATGEAAKNETEKAPITSVLVNGKAVELGELKIIEVNGKVMVPVKFVGEALGFTIVWDGTNRSVAMDDGAVKTRIEIGNDSYYKASSQAIGLTQAKPIGAAPMLKDSRTYVPAELFNLLYSNPEAVSAAEGVLSIQSK